MLSLADGSRGGRLPDRYGRMTGHAAVAGERVIVPSPGDAAGLTVGRRGYSPSVIGTRTAGYWFERGLGVTAP
jgi:hypothetical protein